jgi:hypothetical protein
MIKFELGLLADHAQMSADGKLNILGEFEVIYSPQVPTRHGPFFVVVRWQADLSDVRDGNPMLQIEVVDEDGVPVVPKTAKLPLQFAQQIAPKNKVRAQALLTFQFLELPKYGDYAIHFFINDQPTGSISFHLLAKPGA